MIACGDRLPQLKMPQSTYFHGTTSFSTNWSKVCRLRITAMLPSTLLSASAASGKVVVLRGHRGTIGTSSFNDTKITHFCSRKHSGPKAFGVTRCGSKQIPRFTAMTDHNLLGGFAKFFLSCFGYNNYWVLSSVEARSKSPSYHHPILGIGIHPNRSK